MKYVDIFLCTRYNTSTLSYKWFGRWHITVRITWFLDFVHHATSDSSSFSRTNSMSSHHFAWRRGQGQITETSVHFWIQRGGWNPEN